MANLWPCLLDARLATLHLRTLHGLAHLRPCLLALWGRALDLPRLRCLLTLRGRALDLLPLLRRCLRAALRLHALARLDLALLRRRLRAALRLHALTLCLALRSDLRGGASWGGIPSPLAESIVVCLRSYAVAVDLRAQTIRSGAWDAACDGITRALHVVIARHGVATGAQAAPIVVADHRFRANPLGTAG